MVHRAVSEQRLFAAIHEREFLNASLVLETCASELLDVPGPHCRTSLRELSEALVRHEHLMQQLLGRPSETRIDATPSPEAVIHAYQRAHAETRACLSRITADEWSDVVHGPARLGLWAHVRRSQLLWIALEEMIDEVHHLTEHARAVEKSRAGPRGRGAPEPELTV